ncbi:MAG: DegT/DnrJ/EryC1/StrS family aminotransferase [Gammaproteobacteria bacterium]|nr:MAG: DegT/DnrJ/EryC1/StrS family aminotransferase [Gammaproteobacteria bacterium]
MSLDKINDLGLHNGGSLQEELAAALTRVLASGWFVLGPEVQAFEKEFAAYCGVKHCVSLANGTDALELVLRGVGVDAGDEVITAANAGMYSSTAILAIGAKPVYADIEESSMLLSVKAAEAAITKHTKAIIVTHLYGQMADMPAFRAMADKYAIPLIEDCAQSHGAASGGKRVGAWGDAAAFSFYPTKNLGALGDGGAVVSSSEMIASRVRALRQYGWESKYQVAHRGGRNSRLDEMQAALLRIKLQRLDNWNRKRRDIALAYNHGIKHPAIRLPQVNGEDYVGHLYVIRLNRRDALRDYLKQHGIASEVHYPILDYRQPAVSAQYREVSLPISEKTTSEILTLPCYPELTMAEVEKVCEVINGWHA